MAQFKPKSSSVSAPKFSGGGDSGIGTLLGFMLAQQKGQAGAEQLPGGVATKRTDPSSGTEYQSQEGRYFTADAQNQLTRIKQLREVVKGVQDLGNTLPTDFLGAGKGTLGAKYASGRFGSEQHKTYLDALPAASAGVYRAVTGDNRLSDSDAASRAKPLFWDTMEPGDVREGKNAFLNFLMDQAEQGITPGEPKDSMDSLIRWQSFVNNSKKKFGPPAEGGGTVEAERALALSAIEKGKDAAKVKAIFKQRTGQELN